LAFLAAQILALVNLVMTPQTQRSDQIVISFNPSALAAAPVCVCRLHHIARPTGLTVKACHQFQQLF
jgi:hypothetical protein